MWVWGGKPRSGVLGGSNLCSCVTTAWNRRSEIAVFPFMHIDCYVTVRVSLSCSFVLSYRPSDVQSSILHRCAGQTDGRSYSALPPTRAQHTSGSTRYIQHRIMSRPSRSLATVDYRGQDEDVEMPVKKQKTSSDDVFADLGFVWQRDEGDEEASRHDGRNLFRKPWRLDNSNHKQARADLRSITCCHFQGTAKGRGQAAQA